MIMEGLLIVHTHRIIIVIKMGGRHVVWRSLKNVQNKEQCVMIMSSWWGLVIVPGGRIINVIKMGGRHVVWISLKNVQNVHQYVILKGLVIVPGGRIINVIKMAGRHVVWTSLKNVQNKEQCVIVIFIPSHSMLPLQNTIVSSYFLQSLEFAVRCSVVFNMEENYLEKSTRRLIPKNLKWKFLKKRMYAIR